jgi:hypothetical protein
LIIQPAAILCFGVGRHLSGPPSGWSLVTVPWGKSNVQRYEWASRSSDWLGARIDLPCPWPWPQPLLSVLCKKPGLVVPQQQWLRTHCLGKPCYTLESENMSLLQPSSACSHSLAVTKCPDQWMSYFIVLDKKSSYYVTTVF